MPRWTILATAVGGIFLKLTGGVIFVGREVATAPAAAALLRAGAPCPVAFRLGLGLGSHATPQALCQAPRRRTACAHATAGRPRKTVQKPKCTLAIQSELSKINRMRTRANPVGTVWTRNGRPRQKRVPETAGRGARFPLLGRPRHT